MDNNENAVQSPLKAIRAMCLDCCVYNKNEVKLCPATTCPLYPFRFGKNPFRTKREYSDEQRQAMADRLKLARERLANSKETQNEM